MNDLLEAIAELNRKIAGAKLPSISDIQAAAGNLLDGPTEEVETYGARVLEFQRKTAQQSQLAIQLLGEGSSPATAKAYYQAQVDFNALQKAGALGLVEDAELKEGLSELRKRLRAARVAAEDAGAPVGDDPGLGFASRLRSRIDEAGGILKGTVSAVLDQVAGIGSGLMGQLGGTPLMGGLFGLMMFGYKEDDRLKAQLGEVSNIFVAAGESAVNPQVAKLAAFQEKAQRFYGISRNEIQANLKTYVNAGIALTDVFKQQAAGLGEVGESAVHLSVALDKHFEMSGGTTAKLAARAVREYGMNLSGALDTLQRIAFSSSKAGSGASAFMNWTFQATGSVKSLGIGVEDAALAALNAQRGLMNSGVGQDLALGQAQQGVGEMYAGIGRRSVGEQADFAERLGFGEGLEGRQNYLEGSAGRPDMQMKLVGLLYKDAMEAGGGDETKSRFFLEQKGYGFEGARTIMTLGPKLGGGAKLDDLEVQEREALKNSFQTEAQKTSEFGRNMKTLLDGAAKTGQSLLAVLSNFAAIAITGMQALSILIAGKPEDKERVFDKLLEYQRGVYKAWTGMVDGGQMMMDGIGRTMLPILRPVTKALAFDPRGGMAHPGLEAMASATPENTDNVLNDAFKKLTGREMTAADRAAISGIAGVSPGDVGKLAGTPAGQQVLANSIAASRRAAAGTTNPVKDSGFKPGPAGMGVPLHGLPAGTLPTNIGAGSLGTTDLGEEPLPDGVTPPRGPLGAVLPLQGRWDVPPGYDGPLEAVVSVTVG